MTVRIKLFAALRELVGSAELNWSAPDRCTVAGLFENLAAEFPAIGPFRSSLRFAVNESFVTADTLLKAGDEIVFIPPVAGG